MTRSRIMSMGERLLRVPEVARLLRIDGTAVYALIDKGELKAGKGQDGLVYVTDEALSQYRQKHPAVSR
jgi:hypothetical protein